MNLLFNSTDYSEETISFQEDLAFISELDAIHEEIIQSASEELSKSKATRYVGKTVISEDKYTRLESVIRKRTGLSFIFDRRGEFGPAVYMFIEKYDTPLSNNIFLDFVTPEFYNVVSKARKAFMDKISKGKVVVDLKNARIEGLQDTPIGVLFMNYESFLYKNTRPIIPKHKMLGFTAKELTAILLHEIGHAFTYIEYIGRVTKDVNRLADVFKDVKKPEDVKLNKRKYVIRLATAIDSEDLVKTYDKYKDSHIRWSTTAMLKIVDHVRSQLYDINGYKEYSEVVADQFVARFHRSKELISALDRIALHNIPTAFVIATLHILQMYAIIFTVLGQYLRILGIPPVIIAIIAGVLLLYLKYNFTSHTYPSNYERIRRMRSETVTSIKYAKNLTSKQRKELLESVEYLDKTMKFKPNISLQSPIFGMISIFTSKGRATVRGEKLARLLEEVTANDLRLSALKIDQLLDAKA